MSALTQILPDKEVRDELAIAGIEVDFDNWMAERNQQIADIPLPPRSEHPCPCCDGETGHDNCPLCDGTALLPACDWCEGTGMYQPVDGAGNVGHEHIYCDCRTGDAYRQAA